MIVAVSGYNASGKSTLARALEERLRDAGLRVRLRRFEALYPTSYLKKKAPRRAKPATDGSLGLRKLEGQHGDWNRRFRFRHLLNVLGASLRLGAIKALSRRSVVLFDRYYYDRLVHFDSQGLLCRIARRLAPKPDLVFVLIPAERAWEERILERARRRFGVELERLSESDRSELAAVGSRYRAYVESDPWAVELDSGADGALDAAWALLGRLLDLPCREGGSSAAAGSRDASPGNPGRE